MRALSAFLLSILLLGCGGSGGGNNDNGAAGMGTLRVVNSNASECVLVAVYLEEDRDPLGSQTDFVIDLAPGESTELVLPLGVWDLLVLQTQPAGCDHVIGVHRDIVIEAGTTAERTLQVNPF